MKRVSVRWPCAAWSPRRWGNLRFPTDPARGWYCWVITAIAVAMVLLSAGMTGVVDRTSSATEPIRQTLISPPGRHTATAIPVVYSTGIRPVPELALQGMRDRTDPFDLPYLPLGIDRGLGHVTGSTGVVGSRSVASLAAFPAPAASIMPGPDAVRPAARTIALGRVALADVPVTVHHTGDKGRWHYDTTATIGNHRLLLDEAVSGKGDGGMEMQVHVTGNIANFDPAGTLHIRDKNINQLVFDSGNMVGTLEFEWTASKAESGAAGIPSTEKVVNLPPLAEIPLVIEGEPFTLDIASSLLMNPGFSGANETTHGHFTIHFSGDMGFREENGATTVGDNLRVNLTIKPDTSSMSPAAPFGVVFAAAVPKFGLVPGFKPSALSSDNGDLAQRAHDLIDQAGQLEMPSSRSPGSYVELITSAGEAESGPLGLLPCEQTTAILSFKGGTDGSTPDPVVLQGNVRANPPTQGCSKDLTPTPAGQSKPVPTGNCDPGATGSATDYYGVPSGSQMRPFIGTDNHPGMDVKQLRDAPVYANFRGKIPITDLNSAKRFNPKLPTGLGLDGTGDAELVDAQIRVQPWESNESYAYGGVIGIAAHYKYTDKSGKDQSFTAYIQYLHLIRKKFPPRRDDLTLIDNQGQPLDGKAYQGCTDFGSLMTGKLTRA